MQDYVYAALTPRHVQHYVPGAEKQAFFRLYVSGECALRWEGGGWFACLFFFFFFNRALLWRSNKENLSAGYFEGRPQWAFPLHRQPPLPLRKAWPVETEVRQERVGCRLGEAAGLQTRVVERPSACLGAAAQAWLSLGGPGCGCLGPQGLWSSCKRRAVKTANLL